MKKAALITLNIGSWLFIVSFILILVQFVISTGFWPDTLNTEYGTSVVRKIIIVLLYISVVSLVVKLIVEFVMIIKRKLKTKYLIYSIFLFSLMYLIIVGNIFNLFTWFMG